MVGERLADEAVGRAARDHAVKVEIEALELPDVEGGFRRGELGFHGETQRGRLRLVEAEARRKQGGGLEHQAVVVAFRQRLGALMGGAKQPGLAGRFFDPVATLQYS